MNNNTATFTFTASTLDLLATSATRVFDGVAHAAKDAAKADLTKRDFEHAYRAVALLKCSGAVLALALKLAKEGMNLAPMIEALANKARELADAEKARREAMIEALANKARELADAEKARREAKKSPEGKGEGAEGDSSNNAVKGEVTPLLKDYTRFTDENLLKVKAEAIATLKAVRAEQRKRREDAPLKTALTLHAHLQPLKDEGLSVRELNARLTA